MQRKHVLVGAAVVAGLAGGWLPCELAGDMEAAGHASWMSDPRSTPHEGDYWAVRASYPTGRFEPRWLVDAARQARMIEARSPAGVIERRRRLGRSVRASRPRR